MRYYMCTVCEERHSRHWSPTCGAEACLAERRRRLHAEGRTRGGNPKGSHQERRLTPAGEVLVYRPEHPEARLNGYALEKYVVMVERLGRAINRKECVRHVNGDKQDNRPENLEIRTRSELQDKWEKDNCLCGVESDDGGKCRVHGEMRPLSAKGKEALKEYLESRAEQEHWRKED